MEARVGPNVLLRTADCTATCEPFLPALACLSLLSKDGPPRYRWVESFRSVERATSTGTSAFAAAGMDASTFLAERYFPSTSTTPNASVPKEAALRNTKAVASNGPWPPVGAPSKRRSSRNRGLGTTKSSHRAVPDDRRDSE